MGTILPHLSSLCLHGSQVPGGHHDPPDGRGWEPESGMGRGGKLLGIPAWEGLVAGPMAGGPTCGLEGLRREVWEARTS